MNISTENNQASPFSLRCCVLKTREIPFFYFWVSVDYRVSFPKGYLSQPAKDSKGESPKAKSPNSFLMWPPKEKIGGIKIYEGKKQDVH